MINDDRTSAAAAADGAAAATTAFSLERVCHQWRVSIILEMGRRLI